MSLQDNKVTPPSPPLPKSVKQMEALWKEVTEELRQRNEELDEERTRHAKWEDRYEGIMKTRDNTIENCTKTLRRSERRWKKEKQDLKEKWDKEKQDLKEQWDKEKQDLKEQWNKEKQDLKEQRDKEKQDLNEKWDKEKQDLKQKWDKEKNDMDEAREREVAAERSKTAKAVDQLKRLQDLAKDEDSDRKVLTKALFWSFKLHRITKEPQRADPKVLISWEIEDAENMNPREGLEWKYNKEWSREMWDGYSQLCQKWEMESLPGAKPKYPTIDEIRDCLPLEEEIPMDPEDH